MTGPDSRFEGEIRRALRAASDLIVPAGDGLNKIRERAARRPPALRWLLAYTAHLPRQLARGTRVAASEVVATTHGYSSLGLMLQSARRWPGRARHVLRSPDKWLRPVLAGAAALVIVIGATLAVPRLRHSMEATLNGAFTSGSSQGPNGGSGGQPGVGGAESTGATGTATGADSPVSGLPYLATPLPTTRCRGQGGSATSGSATSRNSGAMRYPPPSLAPGPGQPVGAGVLGAGTTNPVGTVVLRGAPLDTVGPQPATPTCSPSISPTKPATAPPTTKPTTPVTTPPTTPVTTPPTTPVTTPPTTPVTTPPTTPPQTTTPATQSTSDGPGSADTPTGTAAPG